MHISWGIIGTLLLMSGVGGGIGIAHLVYKQTKITERNHPYSTYLMAGGGIGLGVSLLIMGMAWWLRTYYIARKTKKTPKSPTPLSATSITTAPTQITPTSTETSTPITPTPTSTSTRSKPTSTPTTPISRTTPISPSKTAVPSPAQLSRQLGITPDMWDAITRNMAAENRVSNAMKPFY